MIETINHKQTEITPWQIDLTKGFCGAVKQKYHEVEDADVFFGNNLTRQKYKDNVKISDTEERDIFGVTWIQGDDGGDVGVVTGFPLQGKDIYEYEFPKVREEFAIDLCEKLEQDESGRFRMFSLTMLFYERAWSLRGMEDLLVDMCLNEDFTDQLFGRILEHHLQLLDIVLDYDFEAVFFGDDWGQQRGLIMGPDKWRRFIKPGIKQMYEKVKSRGKYVIQHSCGDLQDVMGDLVDIGLDVYNTVQPEIYDLKKLKHEYGQDLTFYGGISTQQFLPYASAQECSRIAEETLRAMGKNGGYIFSPTHAVTPDIPVENVEALVQAVRNFRW